MSLDSKKTLAEAKPGVVIPMVDEVRHAASDRVSNALVTEQNKGIVIIVCGPFKSGKSVFFHAIKKTLPDHMTYGFRATPDGEGDWTQMGDETIVNAIRKKGTFSKKTVEWFNASINNIKNTIPITFIDVGGKMSAEKDAIFAMGTHCIVLCRSDKLEQKQEWEKLAHKHGLKVLASIDTSLIGEDLIDESGNYLEGTITGLVRREPVHSPVIETLVKTIQDLVPKTKLPEWKKEMGNQRLLNLVALGERLGVQERIRTIKDQKTGKNRDVPYKFWGRDEFKRLMDFDMALDGSMPIQLDGIAPVFVYAYLTSHISGTIYITDPKLPDGKILFRGTQEAPIEKMNILTYRTEMMKKETIVHIDIPGNIFNMDEFENIPSPPLVSDKQGVILTGSSIPIPIFCKIVDFYRDKVPYIAIRTPQQVADANMEDPCMIVYGENIGKYISFS